MDQERRRLAVISSHLDPSRPFPHHRLPGSLDPSPVSSDGGESAANDPCVFCKIIRGESPAFKLYEDDICLCILDSNPLTHGHSLIITKSHYPCLEATPPHVVAALCSKVPFLSNAIMKTTQSDSFNLLVNSGSAAGQVIFHVSSFAVPKKFTIFKLVDSGLHGLTSWNQFQTHFHIIPRKAGDKLWPSENSRRQPIKYNQDTFVLIDCIREQLSSSPSDDKETESCIVCESILSKN